MSSAEEEHPMAKYVVIGIYAEDAVAKREPSRAEHLARLQAL